MMKLLRNSLGISFMEIVVATGLMGAVSLGVLKLSDGSQKQTIYMNQNFDFDNYTKELSVVLNDATQCTSRFSVSGGNLTIDASGVNAELRYGSSLASADVIAPVTNNQMETLPITIFLRFDRGENESDGKAVRKIVVPAMFDTNGDFVECINYQTEAQKTAFKLSCEFLGGTFVDGPSGTETCDLSNLDATADLIKDSMKKACTDTLNGTFNDATGHCESINLGSTSPIQGANINLNRVGLNNNFRTTFAQENCNSPNQFIKSINVNGSVNCTTLKFCVPGTNCPNDSLPPPPPPPGDNGTCQHNDIIVDLADLPGDWGTKCSNGSEENFVSSNRTFTWNCVGGDSTANCTVYKKAGCGASAGGDFASAPSTNFCNWPVSTRVADPVLVGDQWRWTCQGDGTGNTFDCSANKVDPPPPEEPEGPAENLAWVYVGQQPSFCSPYSPGDRFWDSLGYYICGSGDYNTKPPQEPCTSKFQSTNCIWNGTNSNAGCLASNPAAPYNTILHKWECQEI